MKRTSIFFTCVYIYILYKVCLILKNDSFLLIIINFYEINHDYGLKKF